MSIRTVNIAMITTKNIASSLSVTKAKKRRLYFKVDLRRCPATTNRVSTLSQTIVHVVFTLSERFVNISIVMPELCPVVRCLVPGDTKNFVLQGCLSCFIPGDAGNFVL